MQMVLARENKREYTQDKYFWFAELKCKFPLLGTKEDEELLLDKESSKETQDRNQLSRSYSEPLQ
jgi:hypothetical protein